MFIFFFVEMRKLQRNLISVNATSIELVYIYIYPPEHEADNSNNKVINV